MLISRIKEIYETRGSEVALKTAKIAGMHDVAAEIEAGKWDESQVPQPDFTGKQIDRDGDRRLYRVDSPEGRFLQYIVRKEGESGKLIGRPEFLGPISLAEARAKQRCEELETEMVSPEERRQKAAAKRQARIERDRALRNQMRGTSGGKK